jgi:GMP synthase (glutamine-hydrolysing)
MNIHFIFHAPFEGPGAIIDWIREMGHQYTFAEVYKEPDFPPLNTIDMLIVMGGPMGVYDEKKYEWLIPEKKFLDEAINKDKKVLGVCLGAQLLASVLGAKVTKNREKEIGWFPVSLTKNAHKSPAFKDIPQTFDAFHWHGDTFVIPKGALHIASSEACMNQAFIYQNRVAGLQFHLEFTTQGAEEILKNCQDELHEKGNYVQGSKQILDQGNRFEKMRPLLYTLLDALSGV